MSLIIKSSQFVELRCIENLFKIQMQTSRRKFWKEVPEYECQWRRIVWNLTKINGKNVWTMMDGVSVVARKRTHFCQRRWKFTTLEWTWMSKLENYSVQWLIVERVCNESRKWTVRSLIWKYFVRKIKIILQYIYKWWKITVYYCDIKNVCFHQEFITIFFFCCLINISLK